MVRCRSGCGILKRQARKKGPAEAGPFPSTDRMTGGQIRCLILLNADPLAALEAAADFQATRVAFVVHELIIARVAGAD